MKILYGINGTGNGHITKSAQIIESLEQRGHEVDILVSGLNKNINLPFKPKWIKSGFTFNYKNGKINLPRTFADSNIIGFLKDLRIDLSNYDRVCSDFEPITSWAAKISNIDAIGISHQYSFLSDLVPRPKKKNITAELFMRYFSPVSLPIGLHFHPYDKDILGPIIRKEILFGKNENKGHVIVYLPSYSPSILIEHFSNFIEEIHLFTNVDKAHKINNILVCPLSNSDFIKSLLSCDKVITAAGFELPSESLYLRKKLICIPISGQYEQACNASALEQSGIRVIDELSQLRDLKCDRIDWNWSNPLDKILETIEYQHP